MTRKLVLLIAIILTTAAVFFAHPPSNIEMSYDSETQILEVIVEHSVGNPHNHYVEELTITHNDRRIISHRLTKQEDEKSIKFQYRLPNVETGMLLEVTAECNRIGKLSKDIKIEE